VVCTTRKSCRGWHALVCPAVPDTPSGTAGPTSLSQLMHTLARQ
jgi:hypothetical protein